MPGAVFPSRARFFFGGILDVSFPPRHTASNPITRLGGTCSTGPNATILLNSGAFFNTVRRGGRTASAGCGIIATSSQEPIRPPPHARGWRPGLFSTHARAVSGDRACREEATAQIVHVYLSGNRRFPVAGRHISCEPQVAAGSVVLMKREHWRHYWRLTTRKLNGSASAERPICRPRLT
jgi:hypothetical protein